MTAAERQFAELRGDCLGFGPGDAAAVETRLHFEGYENTSGHFELRDALGQPLMSGDLRSALESIPCFTATTRLATGQGLCAIGDLTPGSRVITRDNGMQEVRWIGRRSFGWRALGLNPLLRPVHIAAGALGPGVPERDMVVSPNHRFLATLPGEGESGERLTMARDLIGLEGVRADTGSEVEYWQVLFEHHELVLSNGCWSESFRPTPVSLAALDEDGRAALSAAMPELACLEGLPEIVSVRPLAEVRSVA